MFEVEDGKSWDDLNEAKKKLKQEEEELASGVSGQKPPKRM